MPVTVTVVPANPEVGLMLMLGTAITLNEATAESEPLVACTVRLPAADAGTLKVAEKVPMDVVVIVAGVVVTLVPSNDIPTSELAAKPVPDTVTCVSA